MKFLFQRTLPALLFILSWSGAAAGALSPLPRSEDPQQWLYTQLETARAQYDLSLEESALRRLILLSPQQSGLKLELLRVRAQQQAPAAELQALRTEICTAQEGRLCRAADFILSSSHTMLQSTLTQLLSLNAPQEDYERSLQNLKQSFDLTALDPQSRTLLCRFMLKIDRKRPEALRCLQDISADQELNPIAAREAARLYAQTCFDYLRTRGVSLLYTGVTRTKGMQLLKDAQQFAATDEQLQDLQALLQDGQYWQEIDAGERAQNTGDLAAAARHYQRACALRPQDCAVALSALADIAAAQSRMPEAEHYLQRALQSPGISAAYRQDLINKLSRLQLQTLLNRVQQLPAHSAERSRLLTELKTKARDPWDRYTVAELLIADARPDEALELFSTSADGADSAARYPHALILVKLGQDQEALQLLATARDAQSLELKARLERELAYGEASKLADAGNYPAALERLRPYSSALEPYMRYFYASCAESAGDLKLSARQYHALSRDPDYGPRAQLALVRVRTAYGVPLSEQSAQLQALTAPAALSRLNSSEAGELAAKLGQIHGPQSALQVLQAKIEQMEAQEAHQDPALTERTEDLAVLYRALGRTQADIDAPQEALRAFKQGLQAAGVYPGALDDDAAFTHSLSSFTPLPEAAAAQPQWLLSSLRSSAAELYQQQNVELRMGSTFSRDSGESGYSDLSALTSTLQLSFPMGSGRGTLIADHIYLDSGSLSPAPYGSKFGQTYLSGSPDGSQSDQGLAGAFAYQDDSWSADIGTAPQGFVFDNDILGGLAYQFDFDKFSLEPAIYRRPVTSSQLSFAGQCSAGTCFGAVRRHGAALNFSADQGGADGLWGQLAVEAYRGRKVEDNTAFKAMGGWYHRLINAEHRDLRWGVSGMYWHFERDLSGYTLGQGGYYSPQQYFSLGPNTVFRQRREDFVFNVEAGLSLSYAKTEDSPRYPIAHLAAHLEDRDAIEEGDSSIGVSGRLRLLGLWRVTEHFQIGAHATYQHADGYTPLYAGLFFNYCFKPWLGDLPLAIEPPVPFTER